MGVSINMESVSHSSWAAFLVKAYELGISLPTKQYSDPNDYDSYSLNGKEMKRVVEEFESNLPKTCDVIFVIDTLKQVTRQLKEGEDVLIGL